MKIGKDRVKSFVIGEEGPTAVEYAVMLALIILVCIGAIALLGEKVRDIFMGVNAGLE